MEGQEQRIGTILITGANGSLALPAVLHLLSRTSYTIVLTVRDASDDNPNTHALREAVAPFQHRTSVRALDLANLSPVHEFARSLETEIATGHLPPLVSIICNAYCWDLVSAPEQTTDDLEKTIQVNHVAHAALVLRLVGSFGPADDCGLGLGRVVFFASDAHWPGKNGLEKYTPTIPDDLDVLVKPPVDKGGDHMGYGFQRYAVSKLVIVMWMYAFNEYLQKDPNLKHLTAVAINPGNLSDSRALQVNTPFILQILSRFVIRPFRPLLRFVDPIMRTASEAGMDVAELAVSETYAGESGYFTLLEKSTSSPESLDWEKQQRLWKKTLEWAGITADDTALSVGV
ncbi:hypothetical protein EYZ11_007101 [Aspergillus tanneri]|uniref:Ketoreductase (KR) domain-containing protein n=1 Tax=Aspergillus tanneri TaxID=1220188 RepID=A0A4S3JDS1_9EURO|nr:uncharacterized protein ATNIH1004_010520 [Aspergillus tanneri]KAA8643746.1 hypothetical protein ATNIH1004_010520 [Aspergillus tanneri]THC93406.1 hypothetical protein EYZ11_007101 [Aspergillus tanneri]